MISEFPSDVTLSLDEKGDINCSLVYIDMKQPTVNKTLLIQDISRVFVSSRWFAFKSISKDVKSS